MKKDASKGSLHAYTCVKTHIRVLTWNVWTDLGCMKNYAYRQEKFACIHTCVRLTSGFFHTAWTPACIKGRHMQQCSLI